MCNLVVFPVISGLTRLDLTASTFDPNMLASLAANPIKELVVSGSHVRAKHLVHFPRCETLVARNCVLDGDFLPTMPLLKNLDVESTVGHFDNYPSTIRKLCVPIGPIPTLPYVQSLHVSFGHSSRITGNVETLVLDFCAVATFRLPHLKRLHLIHTSLAPLRDLCRVEKLVLEDCRIDDPAVLCNVQPAVLVVDQCYGSLAYLCAETVYIKCSDIVVLPKCDRLIVCACVATMHGLTGIPCSQMIV
jgi:hypothetical protein